MDVYATEEEQAEAVKKWLKENGPAILVGLVLGLGGLSGWRYWQASQRAQAEAASSAFEQLTAFVQAGKTEDARKLGQTLIGDFPKSSYAGFTALMLARLAVEKNDLEAARKQLQWAVDHGGLPELKRLAELRLARVLLAEGKADEAWKAAQAVGDQPPSAALSELKGDILAAQGKREEARQQYLDATAQTATADNGETSALAMKLDNLGVAAAAANRAP